MKKQFILGMLIFSGISMLATSGCNNTENAPQNKLSNDSRIESKDNNNTTSPTSAISITPYYKNKVQSSADKPNTKISMASKAKETISNSSTSSNTKNVETTEKNLSEAYNRGFQQFLSRKYQDAINTESAVIKENPAYFEAYNVKGIAQCYLGNYKDGMTNINKALEINPDFEYARFNKALAYELQGSYDESLNWYDKALEIKTNVWSYYGKASIYGRRGDVKNVMKYLNLALPLEPQIRSFAKEESDFNNVKKTKEFQDFINGQ